MRLGHHGQLQTEWNILIYCIYDIRSRKPVFFFFAQKHALQKNL